MKHRTTLIVVLAVALVVGFVFTLPKLFNKSSEEIVSSNINNNISTKEPEEVVVAKEEIQNQESDKKNLNQKIEANKKKEVVANQDLTQTKQDDTQLPELPKGFSWQRMEAINGWVAKPQNWYFAYEKSGSTNAYFVSKQEITDKDHFFESGLSINAIPSSGVPGGDAYKYAKYYINKYQEFGEIEFSDEEEVGVISVLRLSGKFQEAGAEFNMAVEILANRKTNTLYVIQFEAPIDEWEKEWEIGSQMLDLIALDDEI